MGMRATRWAGPAIVCIGLLLLVSRGFWKALPGWVKFLAFLVVVVLFVLFALGRIP